MTIEEMKSRKKELGLTNEMIAKVSGIPLGTVQKIFSGATRSPRKLTIDAISAVLRLPDPHVTVPGSYISSPECLSAFREPPVLYNTMRKDKLHTIEDYYALPDDRRVELIDGIFYDMGAPAAIHQIILIQLAIRFEECAASHGEPCEVLIAPCDVLLDRDPYTVVQPDILLLCGAFDLRSIRIEGAPDLIVEILSDSTRAHDRFRKLYKYQNAGVREYWIVDPKHRSVTVHYFEEEDYAPVRFDFTDRIPVRISEGKCTIDFSRILKKISSYYD